MLGKFYMAPTWAVQCPIVGPIQPIRQYNTSTSIIIQGPTHRTLWALVTEKLLIINTQVLRGGGVLAFVTHFGITSEFISDCITGGERGLAGLTQPAQ